MLSPEVKKELLQRPVSRTAMFGSALEEGIAKEQLARTENAKVLGQGVLKDQMLADSEMTEKAKLSYIAHFSLEELLSIAKSYGEVKIDTPRAWQCDWKCEVEIKINFTVKDKSLDTRMWISGRGDTDKEAAIIAIRKAHTIKACLIGNN